MLEVCRSAGAGSGTGPEEATVTQDGRRGARGWSTGFWLIAIALGLSVVLAPGLAAPAWHAHPSAPTGADLTVASHPHDPFTYVSGNPQTYGNFGDSVSVGGTVVAVGALGEIVSGDAYAGHVYLFSSKTGVLLRTLTSPNAQAYGDFGASVATDGKTVVVGAPDETVSGLVDAGRAYVFSVSGTLLTTLVSPAAQTFGGFGDKVALSGSTVVVGAPYETVAGQPGAGHVYVFATSGTLLVTLASPGALYYGGQRASDFGLALAITGPTLVVGAPGENTSAGPRAGHAYLFKAKTGALLAVLSSPNAAAYGYFGISVGISGKTVVVGAYNETVSGQGTAGRAYAFQAPTGALLATFVSPNIQATGYFGASIAISKSTVLVGAYGEIVAGFAYAGHAYTFSVSGASLATLTSPSPQLQGFFGDTVAMSGSTIVVGASGETAAGFSFAGHAYQS